MNTTEKDDVRKTYTEREIDKARREREEAAKKQEWIDNANALRRSYSPIRTEKSLWVSILTLSAIGITYAILSSP